METAHNDPCIPGNRKHEGTIQAERHVTDSLPYGGIKPKERVGVGGLFRLFAYEILRNGTGPVL
jgi:hypothetical protein